MPNMCDSDVMIDEVMGALIANGLDPKTFEAVSKLIRTYGDLMVQDHKTKLLPMYGMNGRKRSQVTTQMKQHDNPDS